MMADYLCPVCGKPLMTGFNCPLGCGTFLPPRDDIRVTNKNPVIAKTHYEYRDGRESIE
jgi:hypothetical protein